MQALTFFSKSSLVAFSHLSVPRPTSHTRKSLQKIFAASQHNSQTLQTSSPQLRFYHPAASKLAVQKFPTATAPSPKTSTSSNIAAQRSEAIARHFSSTSSQAENNMNLYSYSKTPSEYTPRTVGQPYTLDYRCYIEKNGQPVSPFHDIPLYANEQQTILNMVVEIPRWSNAKQEVKGLQYLLHCD